MSNINFLPIPGYSKQSVWGWDQMTETYFAQIWKDSTSGDNPPDVWISGLPPVLSEAILATSIGEKLNIDATKVLHYMREGYRQ